MKVWRIEVNQMQTVDIIYYLCILLFYLYLCVCVYVPICMPSAHGGQKKASDPLEQKLQAVVSHHGFRNHT